MRFQSGFCEDQADQQGFNLICSAKSEMEKRAWMIPGKSLLDLRIFRNDLHLQRVLRGFPQCSHIVSTFPDHLIMILKLFWELGVDHSKFHRFWNQGNELSDGLTKVVSFRLFGKICQTNLKVSKAPCQPDHNQLHTCQLLKRHYEFVTEIALGFFVVYLFYFNEDIYSFEACLITFCGTNNYSTNL